MYPYGYYSILHLRMCRAKTIEQAFIIVSRQTFELGQRLSPQGAKVSSLLFGQDIQLCRLCNNTSLHASWTFPQTRWHGNQYQHCSNTNTLTHLRCLEPTALGMQGYQDPKVSVILNWVEEGDQEENRWEMLFHVGWNGIRCLVCKTTL